LAFCSFLERNQNGHLTANLNKFGDDAECNWVSMPIVEWRIFSSSSPSWATTESFSGAGGLSCPVVNDGDINYSAAASAFTLFFGVTVGLWLLSKNLGAVLNAIKRM